MSTARLDGRVAIITGAAGGVGSAAARAFAEEGARLVVTDADGDGATRLASELGEIATARGHDVTNEADWEAVVALGLEAHGRIDILVNNAGVFLAAPLVQTATEDFRRVLDINAVGTFLGMRTVAPAMGERHTGVIINVSSVAGLTGGPLLSAYAASKWAVRGMTKVAARELAQAGIRVVSVHPGQVDTEMNARAREATPELVDALVARIPMGRIATPREVAHGLVYLASDESSYVTGCELVLDGGLTA